MKKVILLLITALASQFSTAANLQAAADDVCSCLEAPYKVVEQALKDLQQAQTTGDHAKIIQAQGEMMGVMNASTQCFDKLPEKHPEIDQSEELQNKVMAMANKQCPNPASKYQP